MRHLLLQLLLLTISSSVLWDSGTEVSVTLERVAVWLLYYAVLNLLVYVNIYILAKRFLLKSRISAYLVSAFGIVIVTMFMIGVLQSFLPDGGVSDTPVVIAIVSSVATVGLLFAGTSALLLFRQWIISGRRRLEMETLNLSAELQALKNQINPHFLFNMLNNCYLLVKKRREDAADVIFRLEDLLRYQIGRVDSEQVDLRDEVDFLNDFLSLEKIRRDNFCYTIENSTEQQTIMLPPMLFIPFVENAVKHSMDSEGMSRVDVKFERWDRGIVFSCVNSKPIVMGAERAVGGLGLRNIRRRLELLYPNRHSITITDEQTIYSVVLKLDL